MSDAMVIERTKRCDEYFDKFPNFVDENVADDSAPLAFAHQVHKEVVSGFETGSLI